MSESFKVEFEESLEKWLVKGESGWFFPVETEREAKFLSEKLNEKNNNPSTIEDYFQEWESAINEISKKEKELINIKETYAQMEQQILEETDFKELYGANNQKVRDNHVKNELKDLVDKKQDLQLRTDYLKRRIDFIKNLMSMQKTLIDVGVIE